MSASIQNPPASNSGFVPHGGASRWVVFSVAFHALVLGWLVFIVHPPEKTAGSTAGRDTAATVAPGRIEEVARQIEVTQAEDLRAKVQELLALQQELAQVSQNRQQEFADLAKDLASDAPQKTADAQTAVTDAQVQAVQAQADAADATAQWKQSQEAAETAATPEAKADVEHQAADAAERARLARDRAKDAQTAATEAQRRAAQQLGFGGSSQQQALALQNEANAAQEEANRQQAAAGEAMADYRALRRASDRTQGNVATAKRQADASQTRLDAHTQALTRMQSEIDRQQAALRDAQQAAGDANKAGDPKTAAAAGKAEDRARAALATAQTKADKEKAEIEKARNALAAASDKAAVAGGENSKSVGDLAAATAKVLSAQTDARAAQQKANASQERARSATAGASLPAAGSDNTASASTTAPGNSPAPDLDGKSTADLYGLAVETERRIATEYKDIRTADTAIARQIPLGDAAKLTQSAAPQRPDLNGSLAGGPVDDAAALDEHKAAMEKAQEQINSMLSLARGMASQSRNAARGVTISPTVSDLKASAAQQQQLANLATEGQAGENAVDLTAAMQQISAGETPGSPGAPGMTPGGASPGGPTNGGPEGTSPNATNAQGAGGPPAGAGRSGSGVKGSAGDFGLPGAGAVLDSVPGRKVHAQGDGGGSPWMFVDSWYVIGPFPNPERRNLDTRFPPESVIDLDATYLGKGDLPLRWQFVQNNRAAVRPPNEQPYAIYYAYTTLWFDDERDTWIAMGSDDYSKLWINDLLVWASGPVQKSWKPNEGYRKVHFKRGLNRVLFRVENGQAACLYSLMLRTGEGNSSVGTP